MPPRRASGFFKRIDDQVQAVEVGEPGLPATADKWRATLSAMFAWGMTKGLVSVNPCEGIAQAFDTKKAARTNYLHGPRCLAKVLAGPGRRS